MAMTMIRWLFRALACAALAGVQINSAQAQVVVHGTRQIFPGGQREITVRTENVGKHVSLVQAWIDDGDKAAGPEDVATPFALRPPVYRLDPGRSQVMRILFTGASLPQDRESIYWLNVLDIPPAPTEDEVSTGNYLQFSLRTRIKLIYRPKDLPGHAAMAMHTLQWTVVNENGRWLLRAYNPSPYYVNFAALALRVQGTDMPVEDFSLVAPMSSHDFTVKGLAGKPSTGTVQFEAINDQGGVSAQSVPLSLL